MLVTNMALSPKTARVADSTLSASHLATHTKHGCDYDKKVDEVYDAPSVIPLRHVR